MSRYLKAVCAGLGIGLLGLVISVTPFGIEIEENFGLHLLFKLRGERKVPADVVVVAMDSASERVFDFKRGITKWPRAYHARLIDRLTENNVAVIAFDVFFREARSPREDERFAKAIQKAGNVVLVELLNKVVLFKPTGEKRDDIEIVKSVPPHSLLAESALAVAPFALPKRPVKLNSYWTFNTSAGQLPAMPVVVFQIFALQVYDEFIGLLKKVRLSDPEQLPLNIDAILAAKGIRGRMRQLKNFFEANPLAAEKILAIFEASDIFVAEPKKRRLLRSLIRLYQGPNTRYLNFYGPPRTVDTVSYYRFLEEEKRLNTDRQRFDLKDKVVFIGLSEQYRLEQEEGFHTVFSQPDGQDISGVEIAATAFANILEDLPVQPLNVTNHLVGVFFWGVLLGIVCVSLSGFLAAGCILILSVLYLLFAYSQFNQLGIWYPLVIPLFVQSPLAFIGVTIWKYVDVNKERRNIRTALGYQLPNDVVDQLAKNLSNIKAGRKPVYGICLFSDAANYTSLSEKMDPEELSRHMNKYFEVIFEPVRKNAGIGLELKADSMLAIWTKAQPDGTLKNLACRAALEIIQAVDTFNASCPDSRLPTRIGINSGYFSLNFIGAVDHYQYQPVGDVVNTASRIEGLNKHLGTQILVSEEVLEQQNDFLVRKLGRFILAGKSAPVAACQLLGKIEESTELQKDLCRIFAKALDDFQRQFWNEAVAGFNEALTLHSQDGPARFFIDRCNQFKNSPPGENWNGVVRLDTK